MSKLTVLVTTMHQTDFQKYHQMNLQTDAVIANQADRDEILSTQIDGHKVQLVSTNTRGVSRNRNIAIAHNDQTADFIIFADDDLVFNNGYEGLILAEFDNHPEAEAIKFNLHDLSTERKISMKRIQRFERATRRNMSSSGVWGLAVRSNVLKKYNLHFHERFGPGAEFFCGEDTIFIMKMLDLGIKLYRSPIDIAGIDQTESSWFRGFNERYFITTGRVFQEIYPGLSYLLAVRSAYRFSKRKNCTIPFLQILKYYFEGIQSH